MASKPATMLDCISASFASAPELLPLAAAFGPAAGAVATGLGVMDAGWPTLAFRCWRSVLL